jgi:hypothetical protein
MTMTMETKTSNSSRTTSCMTETTSSLVQRTAIDHLSYTGSYFPRQLQPVVYGSNENRSLNEQERRKYVLDIINFALEIVEESEEAYNRAEE